MRAQTVDVKSSSGRVLCCTVFRPGGKKLLAKGHVISEEDIRVLESEGMESIWVTELEEGEIGEDDAVCAVASEMGCGSFEIRIAAGGRANLMATESCCVLVDDELLKQINFPGSVVIATALNFSYAVAGQRIATVKSAPFADTEVHVLASAAYARADILVPYLFMAALLFGVYIFAPGLTIVKRTGTFAIISVSAGVLNLALALALIPPLGLRGAGIATAASSAWFFVLTMHFSQRHYAVAHDWRRLGIALALALGALILGRAVIPTGGEHAVSAGPLAEKAIVCLLSSALIAMLLVRRAELTLVWRRLRRPLARPQGSVS